MTWLRTKLRKWLGIEEQQGHIHALNLSLQIYNSNINNISQAQNTIVAMLQAQQAKAKTAAKKRRAK